MLELYRGMFQGESENPVHVAETVRVDYVAAVLNEIPDFALTFGCFRNVLLIKARDAQFFKCFSAAVHGFVEATVVHASDVDESGFYARDFHAWVH